MEITIKKETIMEIVLVNNRTDKEYIIKSDNDFGLMMNHTTGDSQSVTNIVSLMIVIYQKNAETYQEKGRFIDFSVISVVRHTFLK